MCTAAQFVSPLFWQMAQHLEQKYWSIMVVTLSSCMCRISTTKLTCQTLSDPLKKERIQPGILNSGNWASVFLQPCECDHIHIVNCNAIQCYGYVTDYLMVSVIVK